MSAAVPMPSDPAPPPALSLVEGDRISYAPPAAEVAECACPEFCERDHDRD
jgi:hypothetical protein